MIASANEILSDSNPDDRTTLVANLADGNDTDLSLNDVANNTPTPPSSPPLEVFCSRQFLEWLREGQLSLALTTYQTSRLMFLGLNAAGGLSGFERLFDRAMGLYATSERLYMSSRYQLWQFDNILAPGELYNNYDKLYIPRIGYTTGDLDIHDIAVDSSGQVVFVSTLLNALALVRS
jgi:uncharacterized protein (TIGR03032 family)